MKSATGMFLLTPALAVFSASALAQTPDETLDFITEQLRNCDAFSEVRYEGGYRWDGGRSLSVDSNIPWRREGTAFSVESLHEYSTFRSATRVRWDVKDVRHSGRSGQDHVQLRLACITGYCIKFEHTTEGVGKRHSYPPRTTQAGGTELVYRCPAAAYNSLNRALTHLEQSVPKRKPLF